MERYSRNILLNGVGEEGQRKLAAARVLVIGAGGLGSPVLYYLAAAGIGTLGIVDMDCVEESNLQRQIIHTTAALGRSKVESASQRIKELNPQLIVEEHHTLFTADNGVALISKYDFVVDCCDKHQVKYLINDLCVAEAKPYCHGSVLGFRGEVLTFIPGHADYRTVFPDSPLEGSYDTAAQVGVLGAVAGVVGSIQATEVLKFFTGAGELLVDKLLIIDGLHMKFDQLKLR